MAAGRGIERDQALFQCVAIDKSIHIIVFIDSG
jgi:hypothetical protein